MKYTLFPTGTNIVLLTSGNYLLKKEKISDEIKDYIHADKLHYLSREGLCRAVSDIAPNDLCFACFSGDYSVEVPAEQEEGVKYVLE